MIRLLIALLFIGLNLYTFRFFAQNDVFPERVGFVEFPLTFGNWTCKEIIEMTPETLVKLDVTDYLLCDFVDPMEEVMANVYVGYHQSQTRDTGGNDNIIHPPEHCLPGSGWDIIQSDVVPLEVGIDGEAKRMVIAKGNLRNLVYFWYQSRGRVIARDHEKVMYMFMDRALSGRTDGSLVRFTIPIVHGDEERAEQTFLSIAQEIAPMLTKFVPN